jgi:DNA-binding NtrC family response regulator
MKTILMVDDEPAVRFGVSKYLESEGFSVAEAACLAEAREAMSKRSFGALLLDVKLPDGTGIDFLKEIRAQDSTIPIVVITGHGSISMAVEAMRLGADHFLTKPVDLRELDVLLTKSIQIGSLRRENRALKERPVVMAPYFGESAALERIGPYLAAALRHRSPLLLRGETGTGKGLVAKYIHDRGPDPGEPFVELNCAALKGELLESELFGHARGAFTGAVDAKEAQGPPALFLTKSGDMDVAVQAKFLKVLEEKRFRPLGRVEERVSDFRLISATHQDLEKLILAGQFRQDLLYRINTLTIQMPPLRDRLDELPGLVEHLLKFITRGRGKVAVDENILDLFRAYGWPGNLRELHNVLERAYILSDGSALHVGYFASLGPPLPQELPSREDHLDLDSAEKSHIAKVLLRVKGNIPEAAQLLGVSRATLYRKITQHGIRLDQAR